MTARKPVPAPACPAGECDGYGGVEVGGCTCGQGPGGYYGMHEQGCGYGPCPAGCEWVPYSTRLRALTPGDMGRQQCDAESLITPGMARCAAGIVAAETSKPKAEPAKPDAA